MSFTFLLKKIIAGLILPPTSLLLLALLGALIWRSYGRWRGRFGALLLGASLSLLIVFSIPAVGQRMLASLERFPPVTTERLAGVQAIVVLGGGTYRAAPEYAGDTVNAFSLERVRYAAKLARETKLPLLLTGGLINGVRAEAELMREVLVYEFGVPVRWVETASLDTEGNARLSAAVLKAAGIGKVALVSHGWHLPRAVPLFEREGLVVVPAPTRFSTGHVHAWIPGDLRDSRIALHEYLGRAVSALTSRF
jgi:uncharacterized SAM-binding protein YcdF (DUF218 family)